VKALHPCYLVSTEDAPGILMQSNGKCHVRFGTLALVFDSPVEAEAALDEAALALRLLTVGAMP